MTSKNAEKKLGQFGKVTRRGGKLNFVLSVERDGYLLECRCQGDFVSAIHTQRASEQADSREDYFPGTYWRTIASALRYGMSDAGRSEYRAYLAS